MGIKAIDFERGTVSAAKTLSDDFKVHVVFAGDKAQTNDTTIMLPALDETAELNPEEAAVIRGYTDHEILHKRITDFEEGKRIRDASKDAFHDMLMQAVEDVRVDNAGCQMYYGTKTNLEATANAVADHLLEQVDADPSILSDLKQIAPYAITLAGRKQMGMNIPSGDKILDRLDGQDRAIIEEIASRALGTNTGVTGAGRVNKAKAYEGFKQNMEVASQAFRALLEHMEKSEEEKKNNGNGGGEGDAEGEGGEGEAEGGSINMDDSNPNAADSFTAASAIEKIIKSKDRRAKGGYVRPPLNFDNILNGDDYLRFFARENGGGDIETLKLRGKQMYLRAIKDASSTLSVLKAQTERAILAQDKGDREEATSGRLNRRRLVSAVRGRETVFNRKTDDFDLNTAVQLVVDMSGSMSGSKIDLARQSAILMAEALQKCNVPFEIVGFTTGAMRGSPRHITTALDIKPDDATFSRNEAITFVTFKNFNERLHYCEHLIGNMEAFNNNADGESLLYAWDSLSKRQEARKIMIVFSDGHPSFNCTPHGYEDNRYFKHVKDVADFISTKAEVLGIGIQDKSVEFFYKNHVVINNEKDLPTVVLTRLTKMLGARAK